MRAYPGRGIPRALHDLGDLEGLADATLAAAGLTDATFLWWDLRLHPRYGTIEVREMDSQATLGHAAALAALVRALVVEAADLDPEDDDPPSEALAWSAFRAARDGAAATVLDGETPRRLGDVARDTVARLRPVAQSLGDDDVLDGVTAILECGGAERQREAFATGGTAGVLGAHPHVEPQAEREAPTDLLEALRASVEAHSRNGRRSRGRNGSLADLTKAELDKRARKAGIEGRSTMTKDELVEALEA